MSYASMSGWISPSAVALGQRCQTLGLVPYSSSEVSTVDPLCEAIVNMFWLADAT